MEKGGGSNSESWQRSRSDEAVSWRNKSSTTNDSWSSTYGRGRSPQTSSWRRSSSSSSSEDSWRQRQSLNHSDVTGGGATSRAPDLQRGKVVSLNLSQGYGFLAPIVRDMQQNNSNNLYFRLGENSKSQNVLFELQVGDVLEYISNNSKDSPRILYACLVECKMRSLEDLLAYLDILVMHSIENPERVLREITKCPVGLLQVLNYNNPPLYFVRSVVELVRIISEHNKAPLYATRLKTLYKVFSGTAFLQRALREFHSQIEEKRVKSFLMGLATHNPQSVSDTLPLLNDMVKTKGGEELDCHCQFLLSVLTAGNAISSCNLEWNKMRLVPLESEITGSETDETSMETYFKGLPYVKKQGSYGSVEVYMDTYFRLLKEDCFWGLKKGISNLRKNKWDRKDMRIWPNGVAIGLHFGGSHSGVTIAINTERVYGTRRPMEGNLLCLSDDGGNFDSPIWGIVAHCEDSTKKGMVSVFAEIVDGRDGSAEVEIQGFNRLLLASRIVIAECPTFYKAYQPVLKALQGKDLENFPFADELVYTNWPSTPPQYLTPLTTLDWSCLFNKGLTESLFDEGSSDESLQDKLRFPCLLSSVRAPVHELDNLLKCGHRTSLDESQIEAIKLALSNRLVLIQGPPGTGKTYVGVRMLQLLLTADTLPAGPILVMTYKNHGLDNFLMGCLKFCTNLVRVGRRSNEPSLEEYNLYVKLGKTGAFCYDLAEYRDMLNKVQHKMEKAFMKLRESNVFDSETVINHMPDSQIRLLLSKYESDRHLLNSFPEDISLVESTRGRIGGANDTRHLVTLLYKSISKNIREWMPHKKTFELVENCFSLCKPSREICEIRFQRGVKESNYLEEAEQNLSEDESMDEIISGLRISRENESWLEENFLYLRGEDKNNLFSKQVNLHMDIDKYQWLLNENPWQLNEHCRVLLVHVIMQTQYELGLKRLVDLKKEYNEICGMMKEINERQQLQVLQKAAIVGMTSAGAAMYINVLKMLQPSIVFVEEASEVLEPQVLAALEPSVQHLILIGDHCQLSPHVACHELERWHDFSVSMFERLVEHNKFPFQSLAVQSRMREEFLPMILPIYPHVRSNTKLVRGERNQAPACMTTPMHFWDHSFPETRIERSFANPGEAEMVVALLTWMTAEGESPEQITVLAAYNGQVSLLRNKLEKHPSAKDIQVYSIDRFQGSENKIVIVSLVRSNDDGNIGYLAKRNRLCVSVSRAKGALYFCGNHRLFSEKSPHWRTLIDYFKDEECLSEQIQLHCPRHLGDPTVALCNKDASSFDPLLCARPCRAVLDCGHFCSSTCHHGNHPRCEIQVLFKFQSCGHEATKQCSQDQETLLCLKEISYTFDECGHTDVLKCWRLTKKEGLFCMHACPKELECKHPCTLKCYEDCKANPCGICIQIQKEIAAKEKQREIREIELKQEELEKEISKLKSQDVTAELSILELDSETDTAAEYLQVRDRTEKFIQPKHDILPVVTKIEKVRCQKSQIKFLEAQKELISPTSPTQLLFHGTSDQGIQGILEAGFKLPSPNKQNMFGQGIYFATDSSKSAQQIYTKGSNKLLLCEVLLGRTWTVQEAKPEMNKETINKRGYDSLFSKRDGKGKGGTLYDEFVVYDPCQAIPRYIVHYKNLTFHPASAMPSLISTLDCNLTRVEYEMSQTFTGDTPAEYHFRLAESQFFRMSSRNDYKVIKVEHIFNKSLQIRYQKAKEELVREKKSVEEMLVFHGTDKDAIEKIIEEGFKVGGEGVEVRNGSVYGKGVYTALDPNTSISYSKGGMILLSSALIGEKGTDYKEGGSTNVLVLHRTEHLLPKYIVHFIKK